MRKWILSIVAVVAVLGPGMSPTQAADSKVTVSDEKFEPADITVPAGTTITVQNVSQKAPHSAKAEDGSFDTGYITPGASGQITLSKAGQFTYFCEPHPYKKGTIKVQ